MYLDNFLTLAKLADDADITPIVDQLEGMGEKFGVDFILSVGQNETELAAGLKDKVIVSL